MYEPSNWYWIKSNGEIYSSKAKAKVKSDDLNYKAWLVDQAMPTRWPKNVLGVETDEELDATLAAVSIVSGLVAPKIVVPEFVTLAQARAALMASGLFLKVDTFIKASGNAVALMAWEYTNTVSRNGTLVKTLAPGVGFTDAQLDQLFVQAATIQF